MKCYQLENQEINEHLEKWKLSLVKFSESTKRHVVHFRFEGDYDWIPEGTFVIYSNRSRKVVYMGDFSAEITVTVDSALTDDDGYDALEFKLLTQDTGQLCSWVGDIGYPFWGKSKEVAIQLLRDRRINENDLVETYKVDIK